MKCDKCGTELLKGNTIEAATDVVHSDSRCIDAVRAQLASMTKRAEATEAETAARMIAWLEGLEPDDMPDSATVLERLKRGDWRAVDICPTCRGAEAKLAMVVHRAEVAEHRWQLVSEEATRLLSRDMPSWLVEMSSGKMSVPVETYNEVAAMAYRFAGYCKTAQDMIRALGIDPSKDKNNEDD